MKKLIPIIGFEIHIEVKTLSKMFCQCSADYFAKEPNTNVCPVCLGYPGALPVPNMGAIFKTISLAIAFNCKIRNRFKFDRKHYFYPDLPKGYQISQYDTPIGEKGYLSIDFQVDNKIIYKEFRIRRVHLEEDTGKLQHVGNKTLIDFNRSGVPLIEIVTEPDFHNIEEAIRFLEEIQKTVRWLGISDADMEKGSMRLEPNVSLGRIGMDGKIILPDYKVELKNINSFRFVRRAIEYELQRQEKIFEKGKIPSQETRGYDETKGITFSQRKKESEQDYRYFPEPDIPRIEIEKNIIENIKNSLPKLPIEERKELMQKYSLKFSDVLVITRDRKLLSLYYTFLKGLANEKVENLPLKLSNVIVNKKIDLNKGIEYFKKEFLRLYGEIKEDLDLIDDTIREVINSFQKAVRDYKNGKESAIMFLIGQVLRKLKGKAKPKTVREKLVEKLKID